MNQGNGNTAAPSESLLDDGLVECANCGAAFAADAAHCPYCNALNPSGAESAYMDELEDLMNDTDRLDDDAQRGFESNLKSNAKLVVCVMAIVVAIMVALMLFARYHYLF